MFTKREETERAVIASPGWLSRSLAPVVRAMPIFGMPLLGMAVLVAMQSAPCVAASPRSSPGLSVFVSIGPQKFLAKRIGGEHVAVEVLLPAGQSPATYDPTPKQLVALAEADVYFRIGVPFERQVVAKVSAAFEHLDVVDTGPPNDGHDQQQQHHDHGEHDPHTWMNPRLAKDIARSMHAALRRLDPEHAEVYDANLASLMAELDDLDRRIAKMLDGSRGRTFFVFHPAYGHFAQAYGLKQVAIESGGKSPVAKQLGDLIAKAKAAHVSVLLVQPQFDRSNAELIAREVGASVVAIDPLSEDYPAMLLHLAEVLRDAFGERSDGASSNG